MLLTNRTVLSSDANTRGAKKAVRQVGAQHVHLVATPPVVRVALSRPRPRLEEPRVGDEDVQLAGESGADGGGGCGDAVARGDVERDGVDNWSGMARVGGGSYDLGRQIREGRARADSDMGKAGAGVA